MEILEQKHQAAFKIISEAIDADQLSPMRAVQKYRQGIFIINQALSMKDTDFKPQDRERATLLQNKMNENLQQVQNRLFQISPGEASVARGLPNQNSVTNNQNQNYYQNPYQHQNQPQNQNFNFQNNENTNNLSSVSIETNEQPNNINIRRSSDEPTSFFSNLGTKFVNMACNVKSPESLPTPDPKLNQNVNTTQAMSDSVPILTQNNQTNMNFDNNQNFVNNQQQSNQNNHRSIPNQNQRNTNQRISNNQNTQRNVNNQNTQRNLNNQRVPNQRISNQNPALPKGLQSLDKGIRDIILNEIVDSSPTISFDDIAGLETAKRILMETVVFPSLRPDLFSGLRSPPKGILLFGPPGNGKTLIAKAVASECKATFFSISASSLTSKWMGESEKLVKALFEVARYLQPSIIFIDEMDSVLSSRSDGEHEASRRLKTEFLVQLDGVTTDSQERLLVISATNRPDDIDGAVRRRLSKRIYIGMPTFETRKILISNLLKNQKNSISKKDLNEISELTQNYSGADLTALCRDAALGPLRELGSAITNVNADSVRPLSKRDVIQSLDQIRPSVDIAELQHFEEWNQNFGSA